MKINTVEPEEAKTVEEAKLNVEEYKDGMQIVDKYLMGEPIEKTVMIKKIKVVLRAPSVGIINEIYRIVAKAAQDSYANMQVESSAGMISAYVREYNGKDFLKEMGDEYDTAEGKLKIREYLDKTLIEPVRDVLSAQVLKFYNEVMKAFSEESLDFS